MQTHVIRRRNGWRTPRSSWRRRRPSRRIGDEEMPARIRAPVRPGDTVTGAVEGAG